MTTKIPEDKPVKILSFSTNGQYHSPIRETLFAMALCNYRGDKRLKSQQGIADIIFEMTNGDYKYTQSNISKAAHYFLENDVYIKGKKVTIRKDDAGYYFDDADSRTNKIQNMISAGLFIEERIFNNNSNGNSTIFAFKVDAEHKDTAKERFKDLLGESAIFDLVWYENNLIIFLNPNPVPRLMRNSKLLNGFFQRQTDKQ